MFDHLLLLVLVAASGQRASGASIGGGRHVRHVLIAHPLYSTGSAMSYGAFFGQGPGASFAANNVLAGVGAMPSGQRGSRGESADGDSAPELNEAGDVPGIREAQGDQVPHSEVTDHEDPAKVMAVMIPVMPVVSDETEMEEDPVSEEHTEGQISAEDVTEGSAQGATEEYSSEEPLSEEITQEPEEITEEPISEGISEEPVSEENISDEPVSEEISTEEPVSEEVSSEEPTSDEPVSEEISSEEPVSEENTSEEPVSDEPASEEIPSEQPQSAAPTPLSPETAAVESEDEDPADRGSLHGFVTEAPVGSPAAPENSDNGVDKATREQPKPKQQQFPGWEKPHSFPGFGGAFGWNFSPDKFFTNIMPHSSGRPGGGSGSSASAKAFSSSSSSGNGASFASSQASSFSGTRSKRR